MPPSCAGLGILRAPASGTSTALCWESWSCCASPSVQLWESTRFGFSPRKSPRASTTNSSIRACKSPRRTLSKRDALNGQRRVGRSAGVRPENSNGNEACDNSRKRHPDGKDDPAESPPEIAVRRPLSKHVGEVSGTVCDVCQHHQEKQAQDRIDPENCLRRGIGFKEVEQHNQAEKRVVK